jgi:hypothetical protein
MAGEPDNKSPKRSILGNSPDINRALARELYVESTVNVVNPSSKNSPGKVKPGQMNLFNPKGQKDLRLDLDR